MNTAKLHNFDLIERKKKQKKKKDQVFLVILHHIFVKKHFCNLYFTELKWFKHIINIAVWTIICLYLLVIVAIHIPAVQGKIASITASAISQKLGTKVIIGRVDLGFLNRLIVDDVLIYDQHNKKMLKSARLSVKINMIPLLQDGSVFISSAQVFGAHIQLYQSKKNSKPNYQFVIDSLSSNNTSSKSSINLKINSFLIRHSSISYNRYYIAPTYNKFNPSHINISNLSATIQLKKLTSDSICLDVRKIACNEQSGLSIKKLAFKLEGGRSLCRLNNMILQLPNSTLNIPSVTISYNYQEKQKTIDTNTLRFKGSINNTIIASSDLVCFFPSIKTLQTDFLFSSTFYGNSNELALSSLKLREHSGDLIFNLTGSLKKHKTRPLLNLNIRNFSVTSRFVETITQCLQQMSFKMPNVIRRLGDIHLKGTIGCTPLQKLYANCDLSVNPGNAHLTFNMSNQKEFKGFISTEGLDLKTIFDNNNFGNLSANLDLSGSIKNKENPIVKAKGSIKNICYNNYNYKNIIIDGIYQDKGLTGFLNIEDENINLTVKGFAQKKGRVNNVHILGNIHQLNPLPLHFTNKWGMAKMSGKIDADFMASSINDANGHIKIEDFKILNDTKKYTLNHFHLNTGFNEGRHFLTLKSDFGHAELVGQFDYTTIKESITNFIRKQLPTFPGLATRQQTTNNNFLFQAEVYKTDWLEDFLQFPIHSDRTIILNGKIDDLSNELYINCTIPQITYNKIKLEDITIAITSPQDRINCNISATKLNDNDKLVLSVVGTAHNNALTTSVRWNNTYDKSFCGVLNTDAIFSTEYGQQTAHIKVRPSEIIVGNAKWNVSPSNITYRKNHIDVDQFEIKHGNQYLLVNGIASKSDNDSLLINLNGIDVNYVLNLVNFHSVEFGGLASGKAYITAPFADFGAKAQLQVNNFTFEKGRMGVLNANVAWNKYDKQIDINAIANDGPNAMTYINGYVSTSRSYIDLGIKAAGTRLDFMRSFTHNFMDDIGGNARGEVRVIGPLSTINLTGQLVINGYASITTTGCTYTMQNDTVRFVTDDILLHRAPIYDKKGNMGFVSGGIHHKHLTHLTYDLDVEAQNMLVYDFKNFGENTFYGTVYGSGSVDIHGLSDELTMNVNITPRKNSSFVYNVSNPDAVSGQEFIKWNDVTYENIDNNIDTISNYQIMDNVSSSSDTYINFLINMTPNATVKLLMDSKTNDYITLNGSGTLRATYYNKGSFNMYGTYRVNRGTYGITIQNIIKKNFLFNDGGTITFQGNPYDAALNLQAIYTVNGVSLSDLNIGNSFSNNTIRVNCLMNITGQPAKPIIDFDIDMPTVSSDEKQMIRSVLNSENEMNQQVLYLLGIGRFYPQEVNNASAQSERQQSQTSLAMQSLLSGTLSSQINSVLSQVIKSNNWNFGANISTGDEGWNNAEYEGLLSGRLLNNRLLINGQFGYRDNANTANTSFIGDFDIRYLLFPNGNIAIKMYNQTNDRYFTKSSLNTQGIGLIMKKDFTNIKDLFGIGKKKQRHSVKTNK